LPSFIDAIRRRSVGGRIGNIEGEDSAAGKNEPVSNRRLVRIPIADNVPSGIDSIRVGIKGVRMIEVSKAAVLVYEPVHGESAVHPYADNNSRVVEPIELGS